MILDLSLMIKAAEASAETDRAAVLKTPEKSAAEAYHKARAAVADGWAAELRAIAAETQDTKGSTP